MSWIAILVVMTLVGFSVWLFVLALYLRIIRKPNNKNKYDAKYENGV